MNTASLLHESMTVILDTWKQRGGEEQVLYWLLRAQDVDVAGGEVSNVLEDIKDPEVKSRVEERLNECEEYWADVRYSSLEPVTKLWGTMVNSLRVAAETGRATDRQREVFDFTPDAVLRFYRAARDRMEVADRLYHVFRAMPAPECQAMAALLNVHVDAMLDETTMCRVARLLDSEGPMSAEENRDLSSLANTGLVHATFSGLRGSA
jgi:hypothetical protein